MKQHKAKDAAGATAAQHGGKRDKAESGGGRARALTDLGGSGRLEAALQGQGEQGQTRGREALPSGKHKLGTISSGNFSPSTSAGAAVGAQGSRGAEGKRAHVGPSGSGKADQSVQEGTTTVRIQDEQTQAQVQMISDAVKRAKELLDNAISVIGGSSAKRNTALQANFHSTDAQVVQKVTAALNKIRSAFNGTIPVEVESDGTSRAYVYGLWTDIHLCPPWFADPDPDGRARTLIHECSHKYTGTDDEAYHWDPKFATLSTKDALDNADSYSWFCIDVR